MKDFTNYRNALMRFIKENRLPKLCLYKTMSALYEAQDKEKTAKEILEDVQGKTQGEIVDYFQKMEQEIPSFHRN